MPDSRSTVFGAILARSRAVGRVRTQDSSMEGVPLRRSDRYISYSQLGQYSFDECGLDVLPWVPNGERPGRCPCCNHFNDEALRQAIELYNRRLSELRRRGQPMPLVGKQCTCPCECSVNDGDQDDADYEDSSEPEDDLDNKLTGLAVLAEPTMAQKYGWKTNVISNLGQDTERRMFFEAPGHYAMGHTHDIGIPQESSLTNSENTVGRVEATALDKVLEPWELEAVHLSTGRSYSCLTASFPEANYMQLPTNWHPDRHREPTLTCRYCRKPYSAEFVEWVQEGNTTICGTCGIAKKPEMLTDDPDYRLFQVDFHTAMNNCNCRCTCLPDMHSPTTNVDPAYHDVSTEIDRLGQLSSRSSHPRITLTTDTSRLPADDSNTRVGITPLYHTSQSYRPGHLRPATARSLTESTVPDEVLGQRRRMRELYNLPELRFSNNPDFEARRLEEMSMALEDADIAESFEDYEGACTYAQAAVSFGRDVYDSDHSAIQESRAYMMRMAERSNQQEEDEMMDEDEMTDENEVTDEDEMMDED